MQELHCAISLLYIPSINVVIFVAVVVVVYGKGVVLINDCSFLLTNIQHFHLKIQ